jgi:hypothetical protein
MAENQQLPIDPQVKSPFSPLQTGCAFVMLTNMLIYLGVVLFTFNLLDPSKIDASYLAKRGFTALPEPKSEQDTAYQQLSQEKREQQQKVQAERIDLSKLGPKNDTSSAAELSRIEKRRLDPALPSAPQMPKAALTESSMRSGGTTIRSAPSRLYSVSIYPQATMPKTYSPIQIPSPGTIGLETYETLPVEMAPGISYPVFSLPVSDPAGPYLYKPANPIPEASRGGMKLDTPSVGAESLYTNAPSGTPATPKQPDEKERL